MHFHKWGKWQVVDKNNYNIAYGERVVAKVEVITQKRVCSVCNFEKYYRQTLKITVND
jgi:hypothetical protein